MAISYVMTGVFGSGELVSVRCPEAPPRMVKVCGPACPDGSGIETYETFSTELEGSLRQSNSSGGSV